MARKSARASENAPGDLFVDDSCIDCETCRVLAPEVFTRSRRLGQSVVGRQPIAEGEALRARMAIVSCPTSSIGSESKAELHDAVAALPLPIESTLWAAWPGCSSRTAMTSRIMPDTHTALAASVSFMPLTSAP